MQQVFGPVPEKLNIIVFKVLVVTKFQLNIEN